MIRRTSDDQNMRLDTPLVKAKKAELLALGYLWPDSLADVLADGGWRSKARPAQLPPPGSWALSLAKDCRGWMLRLCP
jgi:hypothetical protein